MRFALRSTGVATRTFRFVSSLSMRMDSTIVSWSARCLSTANCSASTVDDLKIAKKSSFTLGAMGGKPQPGCSPGGGNMGLSIHATPCCICSAPSQPSRRLSCSLTKWETQAKHHLSGDVSLQRAQREAMKLTTRREGAVVLPHLAHG